MVTYILILETASLNASGSIVFKGLSDNILEGKQEIASIIGLRIPILYN